MRDDEHECGRDHSLEYSEEEAADGQPGEVLCGCGAKEDRTPREHESCDDFAGGIVLGDVRSRPFRDEVREVEDGSHPAILVARHSSTVEEVEDGRVSESLLIDILKKIGSAKKWHEMPVDLLAQLLESVLIAHELFKTSVGNAMLVKEELSFI